MSVLFMGPEDLDFPTAGAMVIDTTAGRFRSGWARCSFKLPQNLSSTCKSTVFQGGAVTSAWLSFQFTNAGPAAFSTSAKMVAVGLSGTEKSLGIGMDSTTSGRLCLFKYDGTTRTQLAAESGQSMPASSNILRIDMQVVSYGATATVNVYLNGVSLITFTGDVTVTGMTNFDSVFIYSPGASTAMYVSEVFVLDTDTRALQGLQTLALTGAGTTNNWTNNTFTNINGTAFSDSSPTSVNTTGTDQQYNVTDPTPAVYSVAAIKISARMAKSASPTPTQVKLGYNSGGSVAFGTGATKAVTTAYQTWEQYDTVNPITSNPFLQSEMNALQLDLQSA